MADQMPDGSETLRMVHPKAETPVSRSAKIARVQWTDRHRQRLTWTCSVTVRPCAARSFNVRQYRLWRARHSRPHRGHRPEAGPSASTTTPAGVVVTRTNVNVVAFGSQSRTDQDRGIARAYPAGGCTDDESEPKCRARGEIILFLLGRHLASVCERLRLEIPFAQLDSDATRGQKCPSLPDHTDEYELEANHVAGALSNRWLLWRSISNCPDCERRMWGDC
jgi:hypothetical protein